MGGFNCLLGYADNERERTGADHLRFWNGKITSAVYPAILLIEQERIDPGDHVSGYFGVLARVIFLEAKAGKSELIDAA